MYLGPGTCFDAAWGPSRGPLPPAITNINVDTCRSEGPLVLTLPAMPYQGWGSTPTPPHHSPSLTDTTDISEPGGWEARVRQGTNFTEDRTKGEKHCSAIRGSYPLNTANNGYSWVPLSGQKA